MRCGLGGGERVPGEYVSRGRDGLGVERKGGGDEINCLFADYRLGSAVGAIGRSSSARLRAGQLFSPRSAPKAFENAPIRSAIQRLEDSRQRLRQNLVALSRASSRAVNLRMGT